MRVYVELVTDPEHKRIDIEVGDNATVMDLKRQIEHRFGVKADVQTLAYKRFDPLENDKKLSDYGMHNSADVYLIPYLVTENPKHFKL